MEFNNLIKKASVAREYSELDIARMDYVEERPDYYDGDIFLSLKRPIVKVSLTSADLQDSQSSTIRKKRKSVFLLHSGNQ